MTPTTTPVPTAAPEPPVSTRRALAFVYAGYGFRYAYLLVLIPFYGRILGAEEYGRLLAAMSLYQVVWLLCEFGFPGAGARDAAASSDRHRLGALLGRHLSGRLWTATVALAVGAAGTLASPVLRENPLLGVLATAAGLTAAFNLGWFFQGCLRFRTSVAIEVAGFAINLPAILLLVRGPGDSWKAMAVLLVSTLICNLAAYAIAGGALLKWRAVRLAGGLALAREASALFAHRGATMVMATSSTWLLSLFAPAAQVGWYGAAERLAAAGLSLMQPAHHVLVGTVARYLGAHNDDRAAVSLTRRAMAAMLGVGFALTAGAYLLAAPVIPLLLGPGFEPAIGLLQTLALMFPFVALAQVITGYVLVPLRHDRAMLVIGLGGAALTIVLMVALGWLEGASGVAWARVAGAVAIAAALLAMLRRKRLIGRIGSFGSYA